MGFLDKLKDLKDTLEDIQHHHESASKPDQPPATAGSAPDEPRIYSLGERDVYRYRKQYGLNLGSWFTLERWIAETPFRDLSGSSELDVARQARNAKERLERHWDSWLEEEDWDWIKERGFNTVRIPIGYYHACGIDRSLLDGTEYAPYYDVYRGAWSRVLDAIDTAKHHGIGVLVDIHAAPGAQNKNDHSGTPTNECHFWEGNNREAAVRVLRAIVLEIHTKVNIVGLSLMNEPSNNNQLQGWYESAITSVRAALSDRAEQGPPPNHFPIFIDSAWDPNWYSQIVGKRDDFVVMDHHLYRCFTDKDKCLTGEQQAADIRGRTKDELKKYHTNAHGNLIIGEWSAALSPEGMPHGANAGEQDRQRRVFVQAQREVYNENCAGHFFWTYKKESGWDAGWSSRDASTAAILPEWVGGPRGRFNRVDEDERESLLKKAIERHLDYWSKHNCEHHELWRFEEGFRKGWEDAGLFIACGSSELGYRHRWMQHRTKEHEAAKGTSGNVWEYSHGFEQGYDNGTAARQPA